MTTRVELLGVFETKLAAIDGFLLPAPGQQGRIVMPDLKSRVEESHASIDDSHVLEWHICFYWDGPEATTKNAHFWVRDRSLVGEEAMWHQHRDPKPDDPAPTFGAEMRTWLLAQIDELFATSTLRHIEHVTVNNDIERGTANVIMETDTGDFVRQSVAIWKDQSEEWQFKLINEG